MRSFALYLTEVSQALFSEVGDLQRDEPERAMLRAQHLLGGGVMSVAIEHIGDLTHRMSEKVTWRTAGYEYVKEKVENGLRWLGSEYGFEREFDENIRNNAAYRHIPEDSFRTAIFQALDAYAAAHAQLPVYNTAQELARDAAVALGERRFAECLANLKTLWQHLGSVEAWVAFAHQNVDPLTEEKIDALLRIPAEIAGDDYAPITDFLSQTPADFDTRRLALATLHDVEVRLLPTYPRTLLIADIIPTQESVYLPNLADMLDHIERLIHEKPITVMCYQREYYCLDGHHRLVAMAVSGFRVIDAQVVNI